MKLLFVTILLASSTSFAAFLPKCDSHILDKWGRCADDSRTGQITGHNGKAYCLTPCEKTYEELVAEAQLKTQQSADRDVTCGFDNVRHSNWDVSAEKILTEGQRSWVTVEARATFICKR